MNDLSSIFGNIYANKLWGGRRFFWKRFHSGSGSVGKDVLWPYLSAVKPFIAGRTVVDVGCGDYTVGRRIATGASKYIGCDVVPALIEHHRNRFSATNVEFVVVDAARDSLPKGDVVLIRQVLQHLDNQSVARIAEKVSEFPTAIITEHLPAGPFVSNVDMAAGPGNRTSINSGIVLTDPPFNLIPIAVKTLCSVPQHGGRIETVLYKFREN